MARHDFDVIVAGGGLGGSALARTLADNGCRVLVVEREREFKDRVRGEWIAPWGVAETQKLGIYDLLMGTCAHEQPFFHFAGFGPPRDLRSTTPSGQSAIAFSHPAMQEVMLDAAKRAGAEVWRGATVRQVKPGDTPATVIEIDGGVRELSARLVVCADGRTTMGRKCGSFATLRAPQKLFGAGLMLSGMLIASDTTVAILRPGIQRVVLLLPQPDGRARVFMIYSPDEVDRLQGEGDAGRFVEECIRSGAAAENFAGASACGPLASFDMTENWVDHPYRDGIALIGDAAGVTDPTWGQGLALTTRDARVLGEHLLASEDWSAAAHAYAAERDDYFGAMLRANGWQFELLLQTGPRAEACRARALPLLAQDQSRDLDHNFAGPEMPC
ncbi:MAG TPA: FAD-dependent monooxygenase, partial [Candidatus Binataceae bacterium]|nr:FAD-dependent monooxygenase [Candidatus Binataceae bacterium]